MKQSLDEIAELAEDLGNRNLIRGKVSLEKIAKRKNIELIYGNYGEFFLGEIVHCSKRFYIHLNLDRLLNKDAARTRFTIAHELGHYFIDGHRTQLAKGISLSYKNESGGNKELERQANHFASHLLMPKKHFIRSANRMETGLSAILSLRKKYDVSVECAALHYVGLNLTAGIMIRWRSDFSCQYAFYSKSFSELFKIRYKPPIKFNSEYVREVVNAIDENDYDYFETATKLSRWISTVVPGTSKDILGLEQTIKLGEFGGFTFITFQQ